MILQKEPRFRRLRIARASVSVIICHHWPDNQILCSNLLLNMDLKHFAVDIRDRILLYFLKV